MLVVPFALFITFTCAIALVIICCGCVIDCVTDCCCSCRAETTLDHEESDETSEDSSESSDEFEVTFRGIDPATKDFTANSASTACCICLENEKIIVFQPCGHLVCCYGCLKLQPKTPIFYKCPVCRRSTVRFQRIFT